MCVYVCVCVCVPTGSKQPPFLASWKKKTLTNRNDKIGHKHGPKLKVWIRAKHLGFTEKQADEIAAQVSVQMREGLYNAWKDHCSRAKAAFTERKNQIKGETGKGARGPKQTTLTRFITTTHANTPDLPPDEPTTAESGHQPPDEIGDPYEAYGGADLPLSPHPPKRDSLPHKLLTQTTIILPVRPGPTNTDNLVESDQRERQEQRRRKSDIRGFFAKATGHAQQVPETTTVTDDATSFNVDLDDDAPSFNVDLDDDAPSFDFTLADEEADQPAIRPLQEELMSESTSESPRTTSDEDQAQPPAPLRTEGAREPEHAHTIPKATPESDTTETQKAEKAMRAPDPSQERSEVGAELKREDDDTPRFDPTPWFQSPSFPRRIPIKLMDTSQHKAPEEIPDGKQEVERPPRKQIRTGAIQGTPPSSKWPYDEWQGICQPKTQKTQIVLQNVAPREANQDAPVDHKPDGATAETQSTRKRKASATHLVGGKIRTFQRKRQRTAKGKPEGDQGKPQQDNRKRPPEGEEDIDKRENKKQRTEGDWTMKRRGRKESKRKQQTIDRFIERIRKPP